MHRLLCLIAITSLAMAQAPDSLWMLNYGSSDVPEFGGPLVMLPDTGALVFGTHVNTSGGPWVVRVGPLGDTLWTSRWDSLENLQIAQALPLSATTYLVAGTRTATSHNHVWLGIVNSEAEIIRSAYFSAAGALKLEDVARTPNGNFVVVGYETGASSYRQIEFAMKISADLELLWDRRYGIFDWGNRLNSCCELTNGDLIFVGNRADLGRGFEAPHVIHASGEGYLINEYFLDTPSYRELSKVFAREQGYLIVSGSLYESTELTLYRISPEDQVEAALTSAFGDAFVTYAASTRTPQNRILVAANYDHINSNNNDLMVVCYNADGDSLWSKVIGSDQHESPQSIVAMPSGDFLVTGIYESNDHLGDSNLLLFRSGQLTLSIDPTSVDFGTQLIGHPSTRSFVVRNLQNVPVAITALRLPVGYEAPDNSIPRWLSSGQEVILQLVFNPYRRADFSGQLVLEHNGPGRVIRIPLRGQGIYSNDDWHRNYGGNREQRGNAIARMPDGGFVCAGTSIPAGSGLPDLWAFRCAADGTQFWSTMFTGPNSDVATSIIPTSDGGFAIAGYTTSYSVGLSDFLFLKYSAASILEFSRTYGGEETDRCNALVELSDGSFALAGTTASYGAGGNDFWLLRIDPAGDTLWTRTFGGAYFDGCQGGNSHDGCEDLQLANNGDLVLAGWTSSFQGHMADGLIIRVTQNGDSVWNYTVGGDGDDSLFAAAELSDGQWVFAGYSRALPTTSRDMWAIGTTAAGELNWSNTYGGNENEECRALAVMPGDTLLLVGYTESVGHGYRDIWTVDLTPWGDQLRSNVIGAANLDEANDVTVNNQGGGFIAGTTFSYGSSGDAWVIHVTSDSFVAVTPRPSLPHSAALISSYPNPFNATTTIIYDLPATSDVTLRILSVTGQIVESISIQAQQAGRHQHVFDASRLASGLYFANLQAQNVAATVKLVLLK